MEKRKKLRTMIFFSVSVVCYLFALSFSLQDETRWWALFFFAVSLLCLVLTDIKDIIRDLFRLYQRQTKVLRILFWLILVFSLWFHFFLLKEYPFVALGDEVRDMGLNMQDIQSGKITNIFGTGYSGSFGLVFPSLLLPFHLLFGNTVYAYRVPAAIFGFLDTLLVWTVISWLWEKRKRQADYWPVLASFLLTVFPIHYFYSHTETLIIAGGFLSLFTLFLFWRLMTKREWVKLAILGGICGFSLNLHDSVKPVILMIIGLTLWLLWHREKGRGLLKFGFFVLAVLIGFGPRILHFSAVDFLQQSKLSLTCPPGKSIICLAERYHDSFLVYFSRPTESHFLYHVPLLATWLVPFFLIGLVVLIFYGWETRLIFFFLLFLPLTNSAITNGLNQDHRLAPLFPLTIITVIMGVSGLIWGGKRFLKTRRIVSLVLAVIILAAGFYQAADMFIQRRFFDIPRRHYPFIITNLMYQLKSYQAEPTTLCLTANGGLTADLSAIHTQEFFRYFLPSVKIEINKNVEKDFGDSELAITSSCSERKDSFISSFPCGDGFYLNCFDLSETKASKSPILGQKDEMITFYWGF